MSDYNQNGVNAQITDYLKNPIYPYTRENAVYDDEGHTLPEKLTDFSSQIGQKVDASSLSAVATSGNYEDLSNKPVMPIVNDATLTIMQGDIVKGTFTANASSDVTIKLPKETSSVEWEDVNNKPDFAAVATSGSYTDLKNKPVIPMVPANVSAFYDDAGYITNASVLNYKRFPTGWHKTGTISQLISDINAEKGGSEGMSYMATVSFSDLPASMVQAELKVDIMSEISGLGKVILFTITSSNQSPYHWEYTSAYGASGVWRGFQEELISGRNIKTVNDQSLLGSGNITIQGDGNLSQTAKELIVSLLRKASYNSNDAEDELNALEAEFGLE